MASERVKMPFLYPSIFCVVVEFLPPSRKSVAAVGWIVGAPVAVSRLSDHAAAPAPHREDISAIPDAKRIAATVRHLAGCF